MTDSAKETTPTAVVSSNSAKKKAGSVEGKIQENEIRVTAQGKMRNYVAYAATIFTESKSHTVVLKGMGRVINKTVSLAEILKRRVKGLYQLAEIGSIQVVDKKMGKVEGETTEVVRLLSVIKIVLTTEPEDKAKYQAPVDESQVEPMATSTPKKARENRNRKKSKALKKIEREAKATVPVVKETEEPPAEKAPSEKDEDLKEETQPPPVAETGEASDEKKNAKKAKRRNYKKAKKAKKEAAVAAAAADKEGEEKEDEAKNGVGAKETKKEKPTTTTTTTTVSTTNTTNTNTNSTTTPPTTSTASTTKEAKKEKPAPSKETEKEKSSVEAAAPAPETVSA